ncbi:MAG TPA: hypothetical protein DD806_08855 [Flavobacterium sp.]|nr:hypothetical protein [Flavobacterium sp.]
MAFLKFSWGIRQSQLIHSKFKKNKKFEIAYSGVSFNDQVVHCTSVYEQQKFKKYFKVFILLFRSFFFLIKERMCHTK